MTDKKLKVRAPLMPTYSEVSHLLRIWDGVAKSDAYHMIQAIHNQTGTPQNPVDWSEPDSWIGERLTGADAALARRIWEESTGEVNPRHVNGGYLFVNSHGLLVPDAEGIYRLSERGRRFLDDDHEVIRKLDDSEGMLRLLAIIATKGTAKRGDVLPEWSAYLKKVSKFGTDSTFKDTLRRRLLNLTERGLLERDGHHFSITEGGVRRAEKIEEDPKVVATRTIRQFNDRQRDLLRERLSTMHPKRFEDLVGELLDAMGYQDVEVTKERGDKGVDVVGSVQFGITTVTEVVQVKRHKSNIQRPVLDQLRGALPYHEAIRGTLITLGNFSAGCTEAAIFPGAAPITLINGEKLLDLLFEHQIGITQTQVPVYELDEEFFSEEPEPKTDEVAQ